MNQKQNKRLMDELARSITIDANNQEDTTADEISDDFSKSLMAAVNKFTSADFDEGGFLKRMTGLKLGDGKHDQETMKKILRGITGDNVLTDYNNRAEIILRKDFVNICTHMPEMAEVINVITDAIIECDVATGTVSRSFTFENDEDNPQLEAQVKDIEDRYDTLKRIKNSIVPNALQTGEYYVQVIPYSKIFAEIDYVAHKSNPNAKTNYDQSDWQESKSLFSKDNVKAIMEASIVETEEDMHANYDSDEGSIPTKLSEGEITGLLKSINVYQGINPLIAENGVYGAYELIRQDYLENAGEEEVPKKQKNIFMENLYDSAQFSTGRFSELDPDDISSKKFDDVKGCYVNYLDALRLLPIRIGNRIIGYIYVATTIDLTGNTANPSVVDLSYQQYTRDKSAVNELANLIINSFDKRMLDKNIQLKNEIAEVIMAHKFDDGKLSFIYIPENEVVRFVINEDDRGKGHSVVERSMFSARNYILLTLYNMLFILNNTNTRIHYVRSSGLTHDYSSQIQRAIRIFKRRGVTLEELYSFMNAMGKISGMSEMFLPTGRSDQKAIETDTLPPVDPPISMEFLETQRKQAILGTPVPTTLILNSIDEVDFAKTLEMANTRFLSTISSFKIDFNESISELYRKLLQYNTDISSETLQSFRFKFNSVQAQDLKITAEMINDFNQRIEICESVAFTKDELEKDGKDTDLRRIFRRKMAEEYLPQLDFDRLDEIIKDATVEATEVALQNKAAETELSEDDIDKIDEE
ncbi:MAG: hypothetical protein HDQ88_06915 [Clostridia bacterium]|nr:hypothetical protein [Clostridia bacterium]